MTGLHDEVDFIRARGEVVRQARATIPELSGRITAHVQQSVGSYAGPASGRRRRLIEMAATAAVSHFLDTVEQPDASGRSVDELFRRMGHGEAAEGHDLEAMQAAFRIANHEAWETIRSYAATHNWSADVLGRLGDALFAYMEHLTAQTQLGFDGAVKAFDQDPERARGRLLDSLLAGDPQTQIRSHATVSTWITPATFVVVTIHPPRGQYLPDLSLLPTQFLHRIDDSSAVVVCGAEHLPLLLTAIRAHPAGTTAATSWPVAREEVPQAWGWTTRALDLVVRGVIPPSQIVDCAEHRVQLWLHAEPALRQRLCQELLKPLLAESPNSREILSETLLAWLESRDSAPAIAAKLGVHPQTVRYRWKRINELFGEDLREPEFVIQATMLLKASVPLWKAGDVSDFERFRAEAVE